MVTKGVPKLIDVESASACQKYHYDNVIRVSLMSSASVRGGRRDTTTTTDDGKTGVLPLILSHSYGRAD